MKYKIIIKETLENSCPLYSEPSPTMIASLIGKTFDNVDLLIEGNIVDYTENGCELVCDIDTEGFNPNYDVKPNFYEGLIFGSSEFVALFFHAQQCCEEVTIKQIDGDLNDLVGSPLLQAEVILNQHEEEDSYHSNERWTYSFYKFATIKGSVTVTWYGESNGYYSERVDFLFGKLEK